MNLSHLLEQEGVREELKQYSQLSVERDIKGSVYCRVATASSGDPSARTGRYKLGEVDKSEYVTVCLVLVVGFLRC